MKLKINKKVQMILKIIFVSIVITFVIKEFSHVLRGVKLKYLLMYKDSLTMRNIALIALMGIISFAPLSLYDFILKKKVGIKLKNREVYKYSWIASSISSLLGFGGAASLGIKQHFYGDYVEDKKSLLKEISKIVALNLTGLSAVCLFYLAAHTKSFLNQGWLAIPMFVIAMYVPVLILYFIYRYIKNKDSKDFFSSLLIIFISSLEWATTVALIYLILVLTGASIGFYKFLPVYIASAVIGILSMVPGGVGTFDLTFITGLEGLGVPVSQSLIVILLYRISYYIVPAAIGILLYMRDFGKKVNSKYNNLPDQIISNIAYQFLKLIVLFTGITMMLTSIDSNLLLKIKVVEKLFGSTTLGFSNDLNILVGFLLIIASCMLRYRTKTIYKATIILILLGTAVLLYVGLYVGEVVIALIAIYTLYKSRKIFYRKSFIITWKNTLRDIVILSLSFIGYHVVLHFYVRYTKDHLERMLFRELGRTALFMFLIAVVIYIVIFFINKEKNFPTKSFYDYEEDINRIVNEYKGSSLTHLVYLRDKFIYMNEEKDVMFQYQIYADKIFVLGNPIGDKEKIFDEIENFYSFADLYGYTLVFYQIEEDMITYLHSHGYDFMKIGEEAMIDVSSFEVVGNKMKSLKKSRNRMIKEGYTFDMIFPPYSKETIDRLREISDNWLGGRKEKGYSVGFFDEYYLSKEAIGVIKDAEGEIKGFANIMNMYDEGKSFSVDLMRFEGDSAAGLMDFMFINLIEKGKEQGYERFNMGMAPLANVGTSKYAFLNEKVALQIYEYGQIFYSFKGLRRIKNKYTKNWESRYVAYRRESSLIFTMIQAALLVRNRGGEPESILDRIKNIYSND